MTRENTVNVPVEPTEAMIEAAEAHWLRGGTGGWSRDNPRGIWSAMLSAAPIHEDDWSELERLATEATDGPWVADKCVRAGYAIGGRHGEEVVASDEMGRYGAIERQSDAAFIAAANPATILKLIASARSPSSVEVERPREALEAILKVTGMTPQDVISHQRGIAHRALETLSRKQEPGVPTPGGEG